MTSYASQPIEANGERLNQYKIYYVRVLLLSLAREGAWLVDMLNTFGHVGGFEALLGRFQLGAAVAAAAQKRAASASPPQGAERPPGATSTGAATAPAAAAPAPGDSLELSLGSTSSSKSAVTASTSAPVPAAGATPGAGGAGSTSTSTIYQTGGTLSLPLMLTLLRPFAASAEYLTEHTLRAVFVPISRIVYEHLRRLTDEELKKVRSPCHSFLVLSFSLNSIEDLL